MATWDEVLVERLRYVIYDIDSDSYTWTDAQLEKFLAVGAIQVLTDLTKYSQTLGTSYTVSTNLSGSGMISPDPVATGPAALGNLMVLKAACLIAQSEFKKQGAIGGWKVIDHKSTIDGTQSVTAAEKSAKSFCENYQQALLDFKSGNQYAGSAILSPYSSSNGNSPSPKFPYGDSYRWRY